MKRKFAVLFLSVMLLFTGCSDNSENNKIDAWMCAQDFVERNLYSPADAVFCLFEDADISSLGDNKYSISGWVESKDANGETEKTEFCVTLELTENGYRNAAASFERSDE